MQSFLIAIQFLTRIPVGVNVDWHDKNIAKSLLWYPLVGALMGGLLFLLANFMPASESEMLNAALLLVVWVIITGGLHLDGLADSADAWVGSHGDKQRALEIMKDPAAGPIAVIVLLLVLLVKFSALYSLLKQQDISVIFLPIIIGRCVPLILFLTTPYVRDQGLGSAMTKYLPRDFALGVLLIVAVLILLLFGLLNGVTLIVIVLLALWFLRSLMIKQIQGMTGDTIGAAIEIIEVVAICALVFL